MKNIKYILMVLLGGTLYGTMSSFVKMSYSWGYNAAEISFWQAFLAMLFLGVCTLVSHRNHPLRIGKGLPALLLTGSAIGLTNFLYYQSVFYIQASLAIVLLMQFTWLSLLLEWVLFKHKPSRAEIATVVFILIGTLLASGVLTADNLHFSITGVCVALASSLTYAVYIIANGRYGSGYGWQFKSMSIMLGSSITIFIINAGAIVASPNMNPHFLGWVLILALAGTTIPTALFAAGIPKVGAGLSSILMTVELPVAVLCAHIVLNEQLGWTQGCGVLLMLLSISALNYYKVSRKTNLNHRQECSK